MSGDFKEFFDLKQFDEQRLGEVEFVLNSPAYVHTFRPYLTGVLNRLNALWKDRSQTRKDAYPDDFLGGGVIAIEGLLEFFDKIIEETRMERVHSAMQSMTPEVQYTKQLQHGSLKPVVGLDQDALPQMADPDEF